MATKTETYEDTDSCILEDIFEPAVRDWWIEEFGEYTDINKGYFTPPQKKAIPHIHEDKNTLICSPTGSGKTLSSFASILNELFQLNKKEELENSVYCLYISPLKSLANDIHRNLENPLKGIREAAEERGEDLGKIRHAIRHGDTSKKKRSKMLDQTPHILNTTPETLAILLNSPKFKEKLKTVKWVIVDEIHALAENKRGIHLSLSLERLQDMANQEFVRIGCSATVKPLEEVASFLVGVDREYEVVDCRFIREMDIKLNCPVEDLINTPSVRSSEELYENVNELIQKHKNTLIFTNTRSGAERVLKNLRNKYPNHYNKENSGAHHGSLGKEKRVDIEEKLKTGEIEFVTTSTSLELGIDMPYLDLVIQIGSPKSVSKLLQRVGRSGHALHHTVKGRVFVLDRDELLECSVMLKEAEKGFIDEVQIPKNPLDVLAQHIYGIAINEIRDLERVKEIIRKSYPYRDISEKEFKSVIRYLTADYSGMEEKNIYGKIWHDKEENKIGKRGKMARVIYMTNLGTIPTSFSCDVYTRENKEWIGSLDEEYLDKLKKGDVFYLGGEKYEFRYRRGGKIYVDPTERASNVPRWFSERLPLSYDLAKKILKFKQKTKKLLKKDKTSLKNHLADFSINKNAKNSIQKMFTEQIKYATEKSVSTSNNFYIEEYHNKNQYKRNYLIQSTYGRKFNDGLSRLLAHEISKKTNTNVSIAISDQGFSLSIPLNRKVDLKELIKEIDIENLNKTMRNALKDTELLKRMFRIDAVRSFMILENYKGNTKSGRRQQFNSDMLINFALEKENFAVVEETFREILYDKLELNHIKRFLKKVKDEKINVTHNKIDTPSPFMFGIATQQASDVILAKDKDSMIKRFHQQVIEDIQNEN
ncbi:helicase [archaeon SCG-AAA382B04]|nr:helicase [archaeon SCG-AAA382B04]